MKLAFEPNLHYQREAIQSITDLFEGQPLNGPVNDFNTEEADSRSFIKGVGNNLIISEQQIDKNLKAVQQRNGINPNSGGLRKHGMHFSVEMETGTGKTYVYLRSIYELNKLYRFKKFVVVVPSVAIREGVLKNLEITHVHFQNLYGNVPLHFQVYDSTKVSSLRGFATSSNIEILVLNIDSFAKDENIINKPNDKLNGQKPLEFIQCTRPIVMVDEPQNMETEKRKTAIANLDALCTLRFSATHRNLYHLIYSLNPVKAYDLGLVKQIEVDSIMEENAHNDAYVSMESIVASTAKVTARLSIFSNEKGGVKKKTVKVETGDDLYQLSNQREVYRAGFVVESIDVAGQYLVFSNGQTVFVGKSQGGLTDEVMKTQIRKTIEEHLKKEKQLNRLGIKVLSLFFIDRVANYRQYDLSGKQKKGKFAEWFEEIYEEYSSKPAYRVLNKFTTEETHKGYFSQDRKGVLKDTSGETKADDDTYRLIMKDKEDLLNLGNPLRFIFSHSALREGWDNPNVFQICTLNETKSDMKKRQEIGRGLRLAVDQNGVRTYDQNVNRLTVIANESYDDFAKALQKEIETDCGVQFTGRIKNKRERIAITYRQGFETDPLLLEIWTKLKPKTDYQVNFKTKELIARAANAVKKLPPTSAPSIRSAKAKITMNGEGVGTNFKESQTETYETDFEIPDALSYVQSKTELTRSAIAEILLQSGRIEDILINAQLFLDKAVQAIQRVFSELMTEGIQYKKIESLEYNASMFAAHEQEVFRNDLLFKVNHPSKTIYEDFIPLNSVLEKRFAQECGNHPQVKFYFKLPEWFMIPTPIGSHNPGWAVVVESDKRNCFVVELKNTETTSIDFSKPNSTEQMKIKCADAHFKELEGLEYKVVNRVGELMGKEDDKK